VGFFRRSLITGTLKDCGILPVSKDTLIISSRQVLIKGNTLKDCGTLPVLKTDHELHPPRQLVFGEVTITKYIKNIQL